MIGLPVHEYRVGDRVPPPDKRAYELMMAGHVATEVGNMLGLSNSDVWRAYDFWVQSLSDEDSVDDSAFDDFYEPDADVMSFESATEVLSFGEVRRRVSIEDPYLENLLYASWPYE